MKPRTDIRYEYKFIRLGEGWTKARSEAREGYQQAIHEHARDGWRLVQIFAPAWASTELQSTTSSSWNANFWINERMRAGDRGLWTVD